MSATVFLTSGSATLSGIDSRLMQRSSQAVSTMILYRQG